MVSNKIVFLICLVTLLTLSVLIFIFIKSIILQNKLYNENIKLLGHITDEKIKNNKDKIIISLTTSPTRILLMEPVINSILKQSYSPDIIRINIPKIFKRTGKTYKIPDFIKNNPKIKIFEYDEDYGPIMKCLPTLLDYKNDDNIIIIYCDDDTLLLPKTIETYLKFIIYNPQSVYCLSGFKYNNNNWIYTSKDKVLEKIDVPEGFMSVCLKSNILKNISSFEDYYNEIKKNKDCFQSDDFIIGNYFTLNNIDINIIKTNDVSMEKWWASDNELSYGNTGDGLKHLNKGGHKNAYKRCSDFLIKKKIYRIDGYFPDSIPLYIFTTWNTKNLPFRMKKNFEKLKHDNTEFSVQLYDNEECKNFIMDNFDQSIVNAYEKLIPHSFKSDLWRYCILYIHGGIYVDIKFNCVNGFKFTELINRKETFIQDYVKSNVCNGLLISKKGNPIFLNCIKKIVYNVNNNYYGSDVLDPTGPGLLGSFFDQETKNNMRYILDIRKNNIGIVDKTTNKFILIIYDGYRIDQKNIEKKENTKHYGVYWNEKCIYSNNLKKEKLIS